MNKISAFLFGTLFLVQASAATAAEITISAAASLTNAVTEVKEAFEATHPGSRIATNFAASNPLLQQIREGAPADIFASADQETMNKAEAENLIDPATRVNFVSNTLVLIVPKGHNTIKSVDDLSKAERIAIGNIDTVPAGRYARDSLVSINLWDELYSRYIFGESVRQVMDYVARGEVDAAFAYATDAYLNREKTDIIATMSGHQPILYPVAITASAADKKLAREFVDFLVSPQGMDILKSYGFSPAQ